MLSNMGTILPEFAYRANKTTSEIRYELLKLYGKYTGKTTKLVLNALLQEGKGTLIKYLHNTNNLTVSNLINIPTYFLTRLDYWLLCLGYTIPSLLIVERLANSKKTSPHDRFVWLCDKSKYHTIPDKFFCIVLYLGTSSTDKIIYTLLTSTSGNIFTLDDFLPETQTVLNDIYTENLTIPLYLENQPQSSIFSSTP